MTRARLLFHCQHALGLGHLARSLALAEALQERFDVILLNGGRFPEGTVVPAGVELVNLAPLGHDADYELVSHDPEIDVATAAVRRTAAILEAFDRTDPAVVLIELYPFGRKKFAFELEPLLEAVHAQGDRRAKVVCSLRDILVNQRRDQARHDERAAQNVNRWFDLVLVHSDPRFATLDESFRPATPLAVPVVHTGFVTRNDGPPAPGAATVDRVIVSAGGGMVGGPMFRIAAAASDAVAATLGLTTTIVAGPFLPAVELAELRTMASERAWLEIVHHVPDLAAEIARSTVSVSQCGYNTTMDLLRAGTPALVVPFSEGREDEQRRRAERLETLGVLRSIELDRLDAPRYLEAVSALTRSTPRPNALDLGGRTRSADAIATLCATPSLSRGAS